MIRNHLLIALRQLKKQGLDSFIKIGGFAVGIAACLLIGLYIRHEVNYDRGYPAGDRIYRVIGVLDSKTLREKDVSFPAPMARDLLRDLPEIESAGRIMPNTLFRENGSNEVRRADKLLNNHEDGFTFADPEMPAMLGLPMRYGTVATALSAPHSLLMSKSMADKYFPGENPLGKTLVLNDDFAKPWTVGGVMEDLPLTSHLQQYRFWLSLKGQEFYPGEQENWGASNYITYVRLHAGTVAGQFQKKLSKDVIDNYYRPLFMKAKDKSSMAMLDDIRLELQPVKDIHLKSYDISEYPGSKGDIRFVWLFAAIAAFILLIACINFINLSTAKSANRAREVGIRKAAGCMRRSLVNQFLTESVLYSILSFILGIGIAVLLLPVFNQVAGTTLTIPWAAWWMGPVLLGAAIFIGVVAGIYPAIYLSSFKPALVLKGNLSLGSKNAGLRNVLVVFQFAVSLILIISTAIIYKQMQYMLNQDVGFNKDQVVLLQGVNTLGDKVKSLKSELQKLPMVRSVAISDYLPVAGSKRNGNSFYDKNKMVGEAGVGGQFWIVDNDYLRTMGVQLVAGRNFSPDMPTDSQAVLINQTLAKKLNLKNPVGAIVSNGPGSFPVIGVVRDFNFESLHEKVGPLVLHLGMSSSVVSVKINGAQTEKALAAITSVWKQFSPAQPVRYTFLDESFASMYADVQRMGRLFTGFALLAIVIACLGLFALSAFMAEQRYKEIGIRKVLGATVPGITALLSREFVRLVVVAMALAIPFSAWAMNWWLQDFAYRTPLSWWIFALAGMATIFIALVTISYQSVRAALMNPARTLKSE